MDARHPVSILQEVMVRQHKSLPKYEIADISTRTVPRFRCTLVVDGIKTVSEATAKQHAKREAAANALAILKNAYIEESNVQISSESSSNLVSCESIAYNAVGKLNEFTAKAKLPYPIYDENGFNTSEFTITCRVLQVCAEGSASNKKLAKQIAAHNMLLKLKDDNLRNTVSKLVKEEDNISDEAVIAKFSQLSVGNSRPKCIVKEEPTITDIISPSSNSLEIDIGKKSVAQESTENVYAELKKFNVEYSVKILKRKPFILLLKFNDEQETSVMETGDTYDEANQKLLQKAVILMTVLQQKDTPTNED